MTYEEQRAARERVEARRQSHSQPQSQSPRRQSAARPSTRGTTTRAAGATARTTRTTARTAGTTTRGASTTATANRPPILKIGIAVVLVIVVVFIVRMCTSAMPINVTVNGTSYELRGAKTMQTAIKASGLPVNPGDFISLNGNILEKSAGEPFFATVNNTETADPEFGLHDGDSITLTDGRDIVEDFESVETPIPFGATISGTGAVHKFEPGVEGVLETRTGVVSGETVERQTVDPVDATSHQYNVNTGANKVIAFTFDDGPSEEYTASVLKILEENDAKATFFVIGTEVESYPDLVRQEVEAGHQVCTHTYDHADPVGGTNVGLMDAAGQVDEVEHGRQTIANALGIELDGVSRVTRMPGGNLSEEMVLNLQPYMDYEIGWNIDTQDWTLPGAEAIYQEMISVDSGDIVLCHDGGGDRSQTVEALQRAVPYLKSKGFKFVTMDELLEYPASA